MAAEYSPVDTRWMQHALSLAQRAEAAGEVPVGAVIVKAGEPVAEGWNQMIARSDPSAHAEMVALRAAGAVLGNYRLPGCELYVTLEPCCMCVGALVHARIDRLVFGAADPKAGAVGGCFPLLQDSAHNHRVLVTGGCLADEASVQLQMFFQTRRRSSRAGQKKQHDAQAD